MKYYGEDVSVCAPLQVAIICLTRFATDDFAASKQARSIVIGDPRVALTAVCLSD